MFGVPSRAAFRRGLQRSASVRRRPFLAEINPDVEIGLAGLADVPVRRDRRSRRRREAWKRPRSSSDAPLEADPQSELSPSDRLHNETPGVSGNDREALRQIARGGAGGKMAETEGFEPSIGLYNPITV